MSRDVLMQLRAEFDSARRRRDGARWRVSQFRAQAQELEDQAKGFQAQASAAQESHDKTQLLADRAYRANQGDKARRRVAKRNAYGAEARDAREERDRCSAQALQLNERADILSRELGLSSLGLEYVLARHRLMEAIYAYETEEERQQKLEYCRAADVPEAFWGDRVRYYTDDDAQSQQPIAVHLFYGGGISPTGEGVSPDGLGHAHHQLERIDSSLKLTFARYLDGNIFRRSRIDVG